MTPLVFEAYSMLLSFEASLARGKFSAICRRVEKRTVGPRRLSHTTNDACYAVNPACALYFKEVECLQRSAVLVCLLRDMGMRATLVIGAQRLPFKAHAWVEVDGQVVNESSSSVELYGVLHRL